MLDGAGWRQTRSLMHLEDIRLINLPPYSPALNPAEHIWDELREKYFHNEVFESQDGLEDRLDAALRNLEQDPKRVHSIVARPWMINALIT